MRATSFYLSLGMNKPLKNSLLMSSCPTAWESARRNLKTTETLNTLTEDVFPAVPCLGGSIIWIFSFFSFGCPSLVTLKDNEPRALQLKLKLLSKCCSPSADNRTCLLVKGTLKSLLGITLSIHTWEMSKVNKSGPSASVEKNACVRMHRSSFYPQKEQGTVLALRKEDVAHRGPGMEPDSPAKSQEREQNNYSKK